MSLESLINRGSLPVLQAVMSFTEARHEVLANNVSNIDTVGYKMRDLPVGEFFESLNEAIAHRDRRGTGEPLRIRSSRHLEWDNRGNFQVKPMEMENSNILFHDRNNRFVEKQMSELAKNTLLHNLTVELLRKKYEGLETAIRGRL